MRPGVALKLEVQPLIWGELLEAVMALLERWMREQRIRPGQ